MRATFRPIEDWPGEPTPAHKRKRSPFDSTYSNTLDQLDRELRALGAKELVIQVDVKESEIRLDGFMRADARPTSPGVVLAFESKHGPLQYATDVFTTWHDNLRAITLGLEALRKVERYGISKTGQQYTGWRQIGSGTPMPAAQMTVDEAARFIADSCDDENLGGFEVLQMWSDFGISCYRDAAKRLHPDAGGSAEDFKQLQEAKRILDELAS